MTVHVQSVAELAVKVAQDPNLASTIKDNPAQAIAELAAPLRNDPWIYRIVVGALAAVAVLAVIAAIWLTLAGADKIPDVVIALGSAAVGALGGLLAPSPANKATD